MKCVLLAGGSPCVVRWRDEIVLLLSNPKMETEKENEEETPAILQSSMVEYVAKWFDGFESLKMDEFLRN